MDEIKAQKKALKKAYKKAKRKTVLGWKILTILCAILMVVFIPLCTILNTFDNTVAAFVGGTFWKLENEDPNAQYFTTDFSSPEEMVDYGLTVAQQVEAEGAALLMNNGALPLAKDAKVSTFSSSSVSSLAAPAPAISMPRPPTPCAPRWKRSASPSTLRCGISTPPAQARITPAPMAVRYPPPAPPRRKCLGTSTPMM